MKSLPLHVVSQSTSTGWHTDPELLRLISRLLDSTLSSCGYSSVGFCSRVLSGVSSPPLAICWWDSSVIRAETHTPVHGRFIDKKLHWTDSLQHTCFSESNNSIRPIHLLQRYLLGQVFSIYLFIFNIYVYIYISFWNRSEKKKWSLSWTQSRKNSNIMQTERVLDVMLVC